MDTETLTRFLIAIFLLALAPGPDLLYVLVLSISKGVKTAIITALGLVSGLVVHTFLIANDVRIDLGKHIRYDAIIQFNPYHLIL